MDPNTPKTGGSKAWVIIVVILVVLILGAGGYYWWTKTHSYVTAGGDTISTAENGGKAVKPANFPKDMPLYPKATYASYTVSKEAGSSYGADTSDSQETVMAWFKTEVVKAGWTIDVEVPGHMLSLSKGDLIGSVSCEPLSGQNRISFSEVPKSVYSQEDLDAIQGSKDLLKEMQGE